MVITLLVESGKLRNPFTFNFTLSTFHWLNLFSHFILVHAALLILLAAAAGAGIVGADFFILIADRLLLDGTVRRAVF